MKPWIGFVFLFAIDSIGFIVSAWTNPYKNYSEMEKIVLINPGTSSLEIADQLEKAGVVSHRFYFLFYHKTMRWSRTLQAGEYLFKNPLTIYEVADHLIEGRVNYQELTIPEGLSLFEIPDLLEKAGLSKTKNICGILNNTGLIADLAPNAKNLEGFLFPDTYRWTRNTSAEALVIKMIKRFRQVLSTHLSDQIPQSSLNLMQIVTLASLIETEASLNFERPIVSAVFHNRLNKGIRLQSDPTVIYAAKQRGMFRGRIFQSDLDFESPYNTYSTMGLPPGPIASPGLESLKAALNPADVDYFYFVSNNQGGHIFSRTFREHQKAVRSYRRGRLKKK